MKNKEKTKPTKKKVLLYYLILAACLVVIAAITVGVVFAVRNNRAQNLTLDAPSDDKKPDTPDNPDKPDNPGPVEDTSSKYEFIVPLKDVNLKHAHVFGYNETLDYYRVHEGMDFAAAEGTSVYAPVDGTVTEIITNNDMYGTVIKMKHANDIETVYKFVTPVSGIKVGSTVNRGDVIATVAKATGVEIAEGDHLHMEVFQKNEMVDPDTFLKIISK